MFVKTCGNCEHCKKQFPDRQTAVEVRCVHKYAKRGSVAKNRPADKCDFYTPIR